MIEDRKIHIVRFKEPTYMRGSMPTNVQQGWENAKITLDKGGVFIDLPARGELPHFVALVPFSAIRQIEFKA